METVPALKQLESQLSVTGDRAMAMKSKIEDLLFRAQRIAAAAKNNMPNNDTMFGYDLQHVRREIRSFGLELQGYPVLLGSLERSATYEPAAMKFAQGVMRLSMKLSQSLRALHDCAILAHQYIRAADHKIEAWYLAQDIEEMLMKGQGLPTSANKIVIAVSTPPQAQPPAAGAPPPAGAPPAA